MVFRIDVVAACLSLAVTAGLGCSGQPVLPNACTSTGAAGSGSASSCASGGSFANGGDGATGGQSATQGLEGYWLTEGALGNCIDYTLYRRFLTDSAAESIRVDNDACDPANRGTFITKGTYSLVGRTLSIDLADGTRTRFDVALESFERIPMLRTVLFSSVDSRNWRGTFLEETRDSAGNLTYHNEVQIALEFDATIPTSGAGTCRMTTHFRVVQSRPANNIDEDYSGSFDPVSCHYAADGYQTIALDSQPDGNHPNWVKANVQPKLWRGLRLDPAHPDYLSTLDGWSKEPGTPPGL